MRSVYPEAIFYLRGDFNVSDKHINRANLLNLLSTEHELGSISITHHYFTRGGASDSHLDKIFFSNSSKFHGTLISITCKLSNPLIESHHDLILTEWRLPSIPIFQEPTNNVQAPRIENKRTSITWSTLGITEYEGLVSYRNSGLALPLDPQCLCFSNQPSTYLKLMQYSQTNQMILANHSSPDLIIFQNL